ncbi:MAG: thiamine phosphate synthase [Pyrinomonadaceae bacterium]|nr:thiamine phosphate synthase [Pyrinomonadaceae bacterium]
MPSDIHHHLHRKLIYLVTSGQTTPATTPATEDFARLRALAKAAVKAKIDLLQIREKDLSAGVLYALTASIADITRGTETKLLVNDRADIAASAGADGVHLATNSLPAKVVRHAFGDKLLIGVSTHSLAEGLMARADGADFVVFGPVFDTPAKAKYGKPQGLKQLEAITAQLGSFPVLALGGIKVERVADCIRAGAQGIAAIRMFDDPQQLDRVVDEIRELLQRAGSSESNL